MILILGVCITCLVLLGVGILGVLGKKRYDMPAWACVLITCSSCFLGIFLMILAASWGDSYSCNLGLLAHHEVVMTEYADTITVYEDVITVDIAAMTDFRYKELGSLLKDLRNKTAWYNSRIVIKEAKKANPVLNWMVFAPPEECKIIKLKNLLHRPQEK